MNRRHQFIIGRWTSMFSCGVLSSLIWGLLAGPVYKLLNPASDHLASLPIELLATAVFLVPAAICWPLAHKRWSAFFGFKHFWSYPPLWTGAAFAVLFISAYCSLAGYFYHARHALETCVWFVLNVPIWIWLSLLFIGVAVHISTRDRTTLPHAHHPPIWPEDFASLVAWLSDDRELVDPNEDRFGHNVVAQRIAHRLITPEAESPTIALVGRLGSGKSTIKGFVAHALSRHNHIHMVDISLWPYDTPEAAVAGILHSLTTSISLHVNTISISGVSSRYLDTIEHFGGRWGAFTQFFRTTHQPYDSLLHFSHIAAAIDVAFVLWIEDIERFTSLPRHVANEPSPNTEQLAPIFSLLHLLDRSPHISVVISDTSLRSRIDVDKIARFVETPPSVNPSRVWQQINILRNQCLNDNIIDAATPQYRQSVAPPADNDAEYWPWLSDTKGTHVHEALALILDTPRSFKSALRLVWHTWRYLRGEIDFDSLLVISAIREARPSLFELIEEYIDYFRQGFHNPFTLSTETPTAHPGQRALEQCLQAEPSLKKRTAAETLLRFVFPAAMDSPRAETLYLRSPQSIGVTRHADYWQRYLTNTAPEDANSDQQALRAIHSWKSSRSGNLIHRLQSPAQSVQIESFVNQFTSTELCTLLFDLTASLATQSASTWKDRAHPPGVTSVWRMMHANMPHSDELRKHIINIIDLQLSASLPVVHAVYYFFNGSSDSSPPMIDLESRSAITEALLFRFYSTFSQGEHRNLITATKDGSPFLIGWICWGLSDQRPADLTPGRHAQWAEFSDVLLDAAEHSPEQGIPLLIPFVTKGKHVHREYPADESGNPKPSLVYVAEFDEGQARKLFSFNRLMNNIASNPIPNDHGEQFGIMYHVALEAARRYAAEAEQDNAGDA